MSYLQCTPATIQVPCTGGTTTHVLEAIGTERLAFKVKLKQKYYDLYKVSPPLGFIKPGVKKELFLRRLPGKPGRTKLVLEYIASPEGYDPRKPFVEGADVGVLSLHVRAYSDKRLPDKSPNITGKVVTKRGQKFTPSPGYDDLKLETEIEEMYKDKEKAIQVGGPISKGKLEKERIEKEKDESASSSEENDVKKDGKGESSIAPIQVILPNIWKDLNIAGMQRGSDELKLMLQTMTNENKRLEEIIKQMMNEITFLREALLSTVLKLAGAGPGSGQALSTASTAGTSVTGKSSTGITVGEGTKNAGTSTTVKSSIGSTSSAAGVGGVIKKPVAGAGVIKTPVACAGGAIKTPVAGASGAIKTPTASGTAGAKGPLDGVASAVTESGAGEAVENYLSAMLAAGGPTAGTKVSDRAAAPADNDGGGVQEFALYLPGGFDRGIRSAYMTYTSAASKASGGRRDSSGGGGGGSGTSSGVGGAAGSYGGVGSRGTSSVYL